MANTSVASVKDAWSGESREVELARATTWLEQASGALEALVEMGQVPESAIAGEVNRLKRRHLRRNLSASGRDALARAGRALDALHESGREEGNDSVKQLQFRYRELAAALAAITPMETIASSS